MAWHGIGWVDSSLLQLEIVLYKSKPYHKHKHTKHTIFSVGKGCNHAVNMVCLCLLLYPISYLKRVQVQRLCKVHTCFFQTDFL